MISSVVKFSLSCVILGLALFFGIRYWFRGEVTVRTTERTKWDLWDHGVRLRGVNIWQKRVDPATDAHEFGHSVVGPPYEGTDFSELSTLGANYVHISHPGVFEEAPPYKPSTRLMENLSLLIDRIEKAGMYAVVGFRTGPGRDERTFSGKPDPKSRNEIWTSAEAQGAWAQMWLWAASRLRGRKAIVGYDLMVEPNGNLYACEFRNDCAFYPKFANTSYDWNVLAKAITDRIREVDKETPILVGTMNFSSLDWLKWLVPTGDTKTAYYVHPYHPYEYTHQTEKGLTYPGKLPNSQAPLDAAWLKSALAPIEEFRTKHSAVVAVTEYGVFRWAPGAETYLKDQMNIFEDLNVNYAVWLWESTWPGITYDQFNYKFGGDASRHTSDSPNPLMQTLHSFWSKNHSKPRMDDAKEPGIPADPK